MPIYFYDVRRHANFFILVFNQLIAESFLPQPYPYAISTKLYDVTHPHCLPLLLVMRSASSRPTPMIWYNSL